jgi:tRNA(Ile)-lysidine synthase
LVAEVERVLEAVPIGAAAVVALSGGPDSTALAHLVADARPDLDLTLGHVRHGLRDDDHDVDVVQWHASVLGLPLQVLEVSVTPAGEGIEAAARAQRYAALRRIAREAEAGWLLVGHTADDQAETVLMRLARGTGVEGLAAMSAVRGDIVRPLLRVRRNDLRRFVVHEGLRTADDPMNHDPSVARVVARTEVLPAMERLAPDPVGALARLADLARQDAARLEEEAAGAVSAIVRTYGPARSVPLEALEALDGALASRVVRAMIDASRGSDDPPSAAHVSDVLALRPGQALDLPGVTVTCGGGWLAAAPADLRRPDPVPLPVPGAARWSVGTIVASAEGDTVGPAAQAQLPLPLSERWIAPRVPIDVALLPPGGDTQLGQVVLGDVGGGLLVRSRTPGDRLRTDSGTRKLQDLLVDAGVPRAMRDLVPVVAIGDRILWVPGIAVDAEAVRAGRADPELHLAVLTDEGPGD